jgi:ubiquinone/menaquinone biosynthesis C-methylase UbiE
MAHPRITAYWTQPEECCDAAWEQAYAEFETPEEETRKFVQRLCRFGVEAWPRDLQILEICCGRGSGLLAWEQLGFGRLEGVDLSETLLRRCPGSALVYVGDCRRLQLPDASRDVVCVQGGLHHLPQLPGDAQATIAEARRVLRPGGRLLVVEPWLTPFLRLVHWTCEQRWCRRRSVKLDALARMIERERATYFRWLALTARDWAGMTQDFERECERRSFGKLSWLGRKPVR